ncbi:MAG: VOC family protein [Planctomycetes bacterium]|nr:VOC family protein [Planctomycetota bacterium]
MEIKGVLETAVYARDLEAAEKFYGAVLGLERLAREAGRHVFFRCGRGVFLVFNPESTGAVQTEVNGAKVPLHGAAGPSHLAFAVSEDGLAGWRKKLERHGVAIESEIRWPNGGRSLYFRDPAGNSLELATYKLWGLEEN